MSDSVMRLTFSVLQNRPFGFLKRRVLASETGHIATQYGPFRAAVCGIKKATVPRGVFACIFAIIPNR